MKEKKEKKPHTSMDLASRHNLKLKEKSSNERENGEWKNKDRFLRLLILIK
jgi:hypothetical protein